MRIILLSIIALGLAVMLWSWRQQAWVHDYAARVKEVQDGAVRKDAQHLRYLRELNAGVTEYPSIQTVVSELDTVSGLARGWSVAIGLGAALSVVGILALVRWERLRCHTMPGTSERDNPG